jgi:hypothetical protein
LAPPTAGDTTELLRADAVRLFLERARETDPTFESTDDDVREVAEICVRLDGLPLAIELAAARLNLFSPRDLRDRLHEGIDALGRGARDLPARQRTLRSTIEWSYELLDPDERATFRLFSVFPTARPDTVEAVANEVAALRSVDVLDTLDSLLDKSLVRPTEGAGDRWLTMSHRPPTWASGQTWTTSGMSSRAWECHGRPAFPQVLRLSPALITQRSRVQIPSPRRRSAGQDNRASGRGVEDLA